MRLRDRKKLLCAGHVDRVYAGEVGRVEIGQAGPPLGPVDSSGSKYPSPDESPTLAVGYEEIDHLMFVAS